MPIMSWVACNPVKMAAESSASNWQWTSTYGGGDGRAFEIITEWLEKILMSELSARPWQHSYPSPFFSLESV